MTIEEMEDAVAKAMGLSDDLRAVLHGDGPRSQFDYELAWVRTYLKKVGALENSERGVWRLTSIGAELSDADIAAIPKRVREEDRQRRKQQLLDLQLFRAKHAQLPPTSRQLSKRPAMLERAVPINKLPPLSLLGRSGSFNVLLGSR